jgi:hypothetical protein|tara:strand:- start:27 stop:251 length:225 start_codon:yes stop_codon:yes gene_type:complete
MYKEWRKVEGHTSLVRESSSSAVINTDKTAYKNFMQRVKEAKQSNDDLRGAIRDINNIKSEMHEIKSLLKKLVE